MVKRTLHIGTFLQRQQVSNVSLAGMFPMCGDSSTHFWKLFFLRSIVSIAAPRSCMTPSRPSRMKRVHLTSPVSAREPQGAVGVIENPHLNGLDESVEVNVGGSGRAAKGSQSPDDIPARRRPHSRPRTGTPPPWRRGPGA